MFQAIAMNKHLIDEETNNYFMRFTDNVGYTEEDMDIELLEQCKREYQLTSVGATIVCLERNTYDLFGNILDESKKQIEEPIKSGMISLIYKMKKKGSCLHENSGYYVLKIKRRGIEEKLNRSIEDISFLLDIASYFFNCFDIHTILQKNMDLMKKQLDFEEEVSNLLESKENCKNMSFVEIPEVYPHVTKKYKNVIMMKHIEGNTIDFVAKEDYSTYAKMIMNYNMSCLLFHGMSHGDLHPGNILFIKNINTINMDSGYEYKIGLVDFGIVIRIRDEMRQHIFSTLFEMYLNPIDKVARDLIFYALEPRETLEKIPSKHLENIVNICCKHFNTIIQKKDDFNITKLYDFIYDIYDYNNQEEMKHYALTINEDIVKLQMSLAMINGIITSLTDNQMMHCIKQEVDLMTDGIK
jgi:predicted unusual protein kinase regulating ubiquinone biosynthesis (AarF/ABC1/UbiB family)